MKRNRLVLTLFIIGILSITVGVTYSFFNYTRTGNPNTLSVGRIYFNSLQDGNINLTNIFPISSEDVLTDERNVGTFEINIEGDTTYDNGVEYLVTLSNVENKVNGKQVPLSINVSASNLGVEDQNYFTTRESKNQNIYKIMADDTVYTNNDLLVGYIKSGEEGVNGKVTIKAYFDEDKIAISDTYNGEETDEFGTTSEWVDGRVVLTTSEWNSLNSEGLSFQVKVEANEGIWVQRRNLVMKNIYEDENWVNIRENVTKVEFRTVGEVPANAITSFDVTDASSTGKVTLYTLDDGEGNGTVKAVIAGDGIIYAPANSKGLFMAMPKLVTFDSTNFKVDNVEILQAFFANDISLKNIDTISSWNTSNVVNMKSVFYSCKALTNVNELANWDTSNVENISMIFYCCINLTNINGLANWNTSKVISLNSIFSGYSTDGYMTLTNVDALANWDVSNVEDMKYLFRHCINLVNVNGLRNWNTQKLQIMDRMFYNCTSLNDISGLANWDVSGVTNMLAMFSGCTNLIEIMPLSNWNVSNVTTMNYMFGLGSEKEKTGNPVIDFDALKNWDVSNVTDMYSMFQNINIKSYEAFRNWNVGKVTNFSNMFNQTSRSNVTTLSGLENWNVSSATTMNSMFYDNYSLTDASAINGWNINSSIDFTKMFKSSPVHPEFTKVTGTWSSDGTFTPSA